MELYKIRISTHYKPTGAMDMAYQFVYARSSTEAMEQAQFFDSFELPWQSDARERNYDATIATAQETEIYEHNLRMERMTKIEDKTLCDLCEKELSRNEMSELNQQHECIMADDFMETAPDYAIAVSNLMRWSWNYKWDESPEAVFLKLIRHPMADHIKVTQESGLGYKELDLIGLALCEYASRPLDVISWLEKAHRIESRNG